MQYILVYLINGLVKIREEGRSMNQQIRYDTRLKSLVWYSSKSVWTFIIYTYPPTPFYAQYIFELANEFDILERSRYKKRQLACEDNILI